MATTLIDGTRQIKDSSITNASQNFGTPSAPTDVAIKSYVDSVAQGLSVKPSAAVISTTPLSPANTYSAGVLTATGNGTLTIDGYLTALNDYILVNGEASGLKNGLYKVTTAGTAGVPYVLTRAVEMDVSAEFTGSFVFVEQGTVNASSGWVCTNLAPTVGTTAIAFVQFSGAGEITAGNGLSKSANTLSLDLTIAVDKTTVQTLTNKTLTSPAINTPTGIVKGDVGLGSVDNTADVNKNVLTATKWVTARNLAGNSVDGSAAVAFANKFIVQGTTDSGLSAAQFLGALTTGLLKNTTTTGVLSIAINSDLPVMSATVGGAVPTPPNNTTTFLRGDGTFAVPASTIYQKSTTVSGTQDGANKVFTIGNTLSSGSEQVYINGQLLMPGASNDYVYNGTTTVTFQAGFTAPASTDVLRVYGTY